MKKLKKLLKKKTCFAQNEILSLVFFLTVYSTKDNVSFS